MTKKLDKNAVKFLLQNVDNFMFDCDGKALIARPQICGKSPSKFPRQKSHVQHVLIFGQLA